MKYSLRVKECESEVAQLCLTLCNPVDCSPPSSSVHGILQARVLEWVAISFSRGSSQPRDRTQVSLIAGRSSPLNLFSLPLYSRKGFDLGDTKGTLHAKMGSIKDKNGMDLTEADDIKKRWEEYTEELYKKDLLCILAISS